MEQTPAASSEHPFIESDRVEGTVVYDAQGDHIGTIERLMIEKVSGQVAQGGRTGFKLKQRRNLLDFGEY
jgi:hypothetical protein